MGIDLVFRLKHMDIRLGVRSENQTLVITPRKAFQ